MFVMTREIAGTRGEIKGGEGVCAHHTKGVIARPDRAIQYAAAVVVESTGRGVLDSPLSRGMTAEN
ncbi:hypothetical protein ACNJYA_01205 [Bradyrhizobium sp. DASA03068]|uniref:hypothetical protein n=1 Tax=Bradyrhizobium sp. BLXBL-01 TaxID=3395915 RepID=UPI003F730E62